MRGRAVIPWSSVGSHNFTARSDHGLFLACEQVLTFFFVSPQFIAKLKDAKLQEWARQLNSLWQEFGRKASDGDWLLL